jgi:hypothetical protein
MSIAQEPRATSGTDVSISGTQCREDFKVPTNETVIDPTDIQYECQYHRFRNGHREQKILYSNNFMSPRIVSHRLPLLIFKPFLLGSLSQTSPETLMREELRLNIYMARVHWVQSAANTGKLMLIFAHERTTYPFCT